MLFVCFQPSESIQRNLLNLTTQANVTCSSNEDSCYRTHDGVYNENLGKSWKAGSGVHAQSLTIDLDQTYQFELARIFLSSFQCYNVVMNMSVSCNGVKWVSGWNVELREMVLLALGYPFFTLVGAFFFKRCTNDSLKILNYVRKTGLSM